MINNEENKNLNSLITFARSVTPLPIEKVQNNSDDKWVLWGDDNLYANFLLRIFSQCSLHRSITSSKKDYLLGDGVVTKSDGADANFNIHPVDSLEDIIQKVVFDYNIFNGFALEVQYDKLTNKPLYFTHIPFHHVRTNKSKTKFWVCEDWQSKKNILSYDRWIKGSNEDRRSKIYYFAGYVPSVNTVYPTVSYQAGIENMVCDIMVNTFIKNSLENGFSPAHIISFFKGEPTSENAKEFAKKFKAMYSGAEGLKYVLSYNNAADKKVEVDSIGVEDYSGKLDFADKNNEKQILSVHNATSKLLFGLATAGQLGGNTELETAYQIFKQVWVKNNRNIVENGLNKLFSDAGLPLIEFKDKSTLFSTELETSTREKVLTIDELRSIDGKEALPNGAGQALLIATPSISTGSTFSTKSFSAEKHGKILTDEDFELVKHIGTDRNEFEILDTYSTCNFKAAELAFDDDNDVDNFLIDSKLNGKTLTEIKAEIRKELSIAITTDDILSKLNKLADAGLISYSISGEKVEIKPLKTKDKRVVEVMYDYQVKEGYGAPKIATSRSFCVKLIDNNRLYTRAEIQDMSAIFGYDVFIHSGGYYTNPDTGEAETQCRHHWVMQRVIRKGNKG
jgi:hypothetical protein